MTSDSKPILLFVYGTLRPTAKQALGTYYRRGLVSVCPAKARGKLFHLGGYPGARFSDNGVPEIVGHVVRVEDEETLRLLDSYEGFVADRPESSLFIRKEIEVDSEDGPIKCFAYEYNDAPDPSCYIANGDYLDPQG